jgi:hypothetical protein
MFPWPNKDDPPDWSILPSILGWYARIVAVVIRSLASGVAGFIRGMNPACPGSLMRWVLFGVFAAMSLVVWDALTVQWLLSLTRR